MSNFTIDVIIHADSVLAELLSKLGGQTEQPAVVNPLVSAPQVSPTQRPPVTGIPVTQQAVVPAIPVAAPPATAPATIPTAAPQYSFDMIQTACAECMDRGQAEQLQGLLQKFGIRRIPELAPDQYGAFATELRGLGARI